MGSQLTGPSSSCWNSAALTPSLSLVYKISFPCLYFYIATWSFDSRYISAGKHLIHKMFTLYRVFPLWSWWLAWKALNYVIYWIFLSGLDERGGINYFSNRLQSQKYPVIPHKQQIALMLLLIWAGEKYNTQKNPCVVFATQKNPFWPKCLTQKNPSDPPPSLKYVSGAPGNW